MALGGVEFDKSDVGTTADTNPDTRGSITMYEKSDDVLDISTDIGKKNTCLLDDPEYVTRINQMVDDFVNDTANQTEMWQAIQNGATFESYFSQNITLGSKLEGLLTSIVNMESADTINIAALAQNQLNMLELQLTKQGQSYMAAELVKYAKTQTDPAKTKLLARAYLMDANQQNLATDQHAGDASYQEKFNDDNVLQPDETKKRTAMDGGIDRATIGLSETMTQSIDTMKEGKKADLVTGIVAILNKVKTNPNNPTIFSAANLDALGKLFVGGDVDVSTKDENLVASGRKNIMYIDNTGAIKETSLNNFLGLFLRKYKNEIAAEDFTGITADLQKIITDLDGDYKGDIATNPNKDNMSITRIYLDDCGCLGGDLWATDVADKKFEDIRDRDDDLAIYTLETEDYDVSREKAALKKLVGKRRSQADHLGTAIGPQEEQNLNTFENAIAGLCYKGSNDVPFGNVMERIMNGYADARVEKQEYTTPQRRKGPEAQTVFGAFALNKNDANYYADLAQLYTYYRERGQDMPFLNEVFGMTEDEMKKTGTSTTLQSVYNAHNDKYGNDVANVELDERDNKAVKELFEQFGVTTDVEKKRWSKDLVDDREKGKIPKMIDIIKYVSTNPTKTLDDAKVALGGLNKNEEQVFERYVTAGGTLSGGVGIYCKIAEGLASGYTIQQLANRAQLIKQTPDDTAIVGYMNPTTKTLTNISRSTFTCLYNMADVNADGKLLSDDDLGGKTGRQVMDVLKSTVKSMKSLHPTKSEDDIYNDVMCNVAKYVKYVAQQKGMTALVQRMGTNLYGPGMLATFQQEPQLVALFSNELRNGGIPIENIMRYGEQAPAMYGEQKKEEAEVVAKFTAIEKQKIDEKVDYVYKELVKQLGEAKMHQLGYTRDNLRNQFTTTYADNKINAAAGLQTSILTIPTGANSALIVDLGGAITGTGDGVGVGLTTGLTRATKIGDNWEFQTGVAGGVSQIVGEAFNPSLGGSFNLAVAKHFDRGPGKVLSMGAGLTVTTSGSVILGLSMATFNDKMKGMDIKLDGIQKSFEGISPSDAPKSVQDKVKGILTGQKDNLKINDAEVAYLSDRISSLQIAMKDGMVASPDTNKAFAEGCVTLIQEFLVNKKVNGGRDVAGGGGGIGRDVTKNMPMVSFFMTFVKYKGYTHLTTESIKYLAKAKYMGVGNEKADRKVRDHDDVINTMFGLSGADIVKSLAADGTTPADATHAPVYLSIPKSVYENGLANIYIKPSLQGYVDFDAAGNLRVPANIVKTAMDTDENNTSTRMLILGGDCVSLNDSPDQDLMLSKGHATMEQTGYAISRWLGSPEHYVAPASVTDAHVRTALSQMETIMGTYGGGKKYPLSGKDIQIEGNNIKITGVTEPMTVSGPGVSLAGNVLVFPTNGKLTILEDANGGFTASFENTGIVGVGFGYEKIGKKIGTETNLHYGADIERARALFPASKDAKLKNAENKNYGRFTDFLGKTNKTPTDLTNAGADVLAVMNSAGLSSDPLYTELNTLATNTNRDREDNKKLAYMLDMMKVKFAMSDSYEAKTIKSLVEGRTSAFKKALTANEGVTITDPLRAEVLGKRTEYVASDGTKKKGDLNYGGEPKNNLFGYTAFYRRDGRGTDNDNKGFSMTPPGDTKTLLPPKEISPDQQDDAETRYLNKLQNNGYERMILVDAIKGLDGFPPEFKANLNDTNIIDLIRDGTLSAGGKTITLKSNFMFYLLGECGNESIGLQIDGIDLTTEADVLVTEHEGSMFINTPETTSRTRGAISDRQDVGIGGGIKAETKSEDHGSTSGHGTSDTNPTASPGGSGQGTTTDVNPNGSPTIAPSDGG